MKLTHCFINFIRALLLLQVHCLFCFAMATTKNIATDQTALLALKAEITYDPHKILASNWSSVTAPVCSWVGVECDSRLHRVTKLNLSDMGFNGTIPSQLGNLSFLSFLSIRNNSFYGSLPDDLTRLRFLKFLDLGFNYFSGVIPPWLGTFPKLEVLLLEANNFDGNLPSFFNGTILRRVNFSRNQLGGLLPYSIFNVSSLQIIDLSNNNLHGELHVGIFDYLPKLQELYFSKNLISGSIPRSLFKCSQLQILSLSGNNFAGSIRTELGNLTALKQFYLDRNNFSGSIPSSFGNCTLLQELNLSENNLKGSMPSVIGELVSLQILRIHGNVLSGNIPSALFNISSMKTIAMFSNQFSGSLPSTMGLLLPNLVELRLESNELNGRIPASICNASDLAFLYLSDNLFTGIIPNTLGNLKRLQGLNLANNHLISGFSTPESSFLTTLTNCKQLRKIVLSNNPLNIMILPISISNLSTSLQQFWANNCNNKGGIPREVSNLTSLIALSLENNELTGNIPTTIGRLEKLQVLYLQGNQLQGTITQDLCHLHNLAYLSFGGNKLSGSIPECLDNLTAIRALNFSSNNLSSSIPLTFWNLKYILAINMSSNSLNGFLPQDIGKLEVVEEIDLSSNHFSGEIPYSIGGFTSLTHLSLAKNTLQGQIPISLGDSRGLESLDLSYNNLTGIIPKSLEALKFLKNFNVSFNRLEGQIPIEGPFSNFSAKSYMMNKALCGPPRLQVGICKGGAPNTVFLLKVIIPLLVVIILASLVYMLLSDPKRSMSSKRSRKTPSNMYFLEGDEPMTKRYTYLELKQATDWFSEGHLLGKGSSGAVYRGMLKDGTIVAIKVFNVQEERSLRAFDVEHQIMSIWRHHNIIRLVCVFNSNDFKGLVMEYMVNGNLEKWLHTQNYHLDMLQRLEIMIGTASGVLYLHEHGIVHCDLNPKNVLLDENMIAKICDFGISKQTGTLAKTRESRFEGTIGYVAPEYGSEGVVSESTDVYSFGILLMETFTGRKPTDEMFDGEWSIRRWVLESFPSEVLRIIDPSLLQIEAENIDAKMGCLTGIMEVALLCSAESPRHRLVMNQIRHGLLHIRNSLS